MQWHWVLEGDSEDEVLAKSSWLASREDCCGIYNRIPHAFEKGQLRIQYAPKSERRIQ